MKFLEGKSQSERKKIIAAIVLGVITVCALFYSLVLSGGSRTGQSNSNKAVARTSPTPRSGGSSGETTLTPDPDIVLSPIPDNPFPPLTGGETSRNIFAFYEPPPPRPAGPNIPAMPTEKPLPPLTPAPTPVMVVGYVNPQGVYAQTGNFQLEVAGDKFTPDTKILFNGTEVATQFSNPQRLTAQIPAQMIATEGQRQISVLKPNCGNFCSNVAIFNVQPPPVPDFNFVGLVARKRNNNDTAMLQNKKTKEYISVRLNDIVPDRFRVFSISSDKVVVVDTALKLRHALPFIDEKNAGKAGVVAGGRGESGNNTFNPNPTFDPNNQYQSIPGIPDNIPRYIPPQPAPQPRNKQDEDDDDPNR